MAENKPLIIPELVVLDVDAGPGKEGVIEFLAATVADAGRVSSPDGPAAGAKKHEPTASTGIPGGIAIPHCRDPHVLAPSLGFTRLAQPVDFRAADRQAANLIFVIAIPDGTDDSHLQLLAKLARGLIQTEFTDALHQAADAGEITRVVTKQVQPELLDGEQEAEDNEAGKAGKTGEAGGATGSVTGVDAIQARTAVTSSASAEGETVIVRVSSCPTGIAHTFMAAGALEQAGKDRGITMAIEGQDSSKIDALDLKLIKRANAVIFAHDLPVKGREHFADKPIIDVDIKATVNDAGSLMGKALATVNDPGTARVPAGGKSAKESGEGSER